MILLLLVTPELYYSSPASAQYLPPASWITATPSFVLALAPAPRNGWLTSGTRRIGRTDESAYWLARFDTSGTMLWQQLLDTSQGSVFSSIASTPGGYLIGGLGVDSFFSGWHQSDSTPVDAALSAFDTAGGFLWGQCYGGSQNDDLGQVIATHDGGYAFVGTTSSSDGDIHDYKNPGTNPSDVWIEKVDSVGRIEWERTYGGSNIDVGIGIAELPDRSFGVIGNTHSGDGDVSHYFGGYDIWLLRIDSAGTKLWDETFGSSLDDAATGIAAASDRTMLIVGQRNFLDSTGAELPALWAAKVDTSGHILWEINDTLWRNYLPTTMSETSSDGLLIAGGILHSQGLQTPFVAQLDAHGLLLMRDTVSIASGGLPFGSPFINAIVPTPSGDFVAAGTGAYDTIPSEGFVARFASPPLGVRVPEEVRSIQVFPSPATCVVNISTPSISLARHGVLYNALGVAVLPFNIVSGETHLDVSRLPRGLYYIEEYSSTGAIHAPIVLQ